MTEQGYILPPPSCRASLIFSPPPPFKKNKYSLSLGLMDWNKWWNLFVHLTVLKCQRLYAPQSFCVPTVTSPRLCCCSELWCKNSHLNGCNAMLGNVELAPNNIVCPLFDYIQCVCVCACLGVSVCVFTLPGCVCVCARMRMSFHFMSSVHHNVFSKPPRATCRPVFTSEPGLANE